MSEKPTYTAAHYRHLDRVRVRFSLPREANGLVGPAHDQIKDITTYNVVERYDRIRFPSGNLTSSLTRGFYVMGPERIVKEYPFCIVGETAGDYQVVYPLVQDDATHSAQGRPGVYQSGVSIHHPNVVVRGSCLFGILVMKNPSTGEMHYETIPRTLTTVQEALNWRARNVFRVAREGVRVQPESLAERNLRSARQLEEMARQVQLQQMMIRPAQPHQIWWGPDWTWRQGGGIRVVEVEGFQVQMQQAVVSAAPDEAWTPAVLT